MGRQAPELMKGLGNKFVEEELEDPFEQYTMKTTSLDLLTKQSNRAMPTALPRCDSQPHLGAPCCLYRGWLAALLLRGLVGSAWITSSPNNEGELATALNFRPWVARDRRASMQVRERRLGIQGDKGRGRVRVQVHCV